VHLLVISVLFMKCNPIEILQWPININTDIQSISDFHDDSMVTWILDWVMRLVEIGCVTDVSVFLVLSLFKTNTEYRLSTQQPAPR
jgi:hypothetical protein